jgi:hypothetical protein
MRQCSAFHAQLSDRGGYQNFRRAIAVAIRAGKPCLEGQHGCLAQSQGSATDEHRQARIVEDPARWDREG